MDHLETLSNCSETSRTSECMSSNISTSSLSEYQDEFIELKQVLDDTTKSGRVAANIIRCYEKQIVILNTQLQDTLKQSENYKNSTYMLEKKKDLSYGEKIEKLLAQNKQLEDNLLAANTQIKRLIDVCHKNDNFDADIVLLEEKNLRLEKINHELTNQIYLLSNKINHCSFQKNEIEHECKNFKSELSDLKLELAAKTECVNELKSKLSEQHIQLHETFQNNVKLSHSLELVSNDLEYTKKSENWYKIELQRIQQEKSNLADKILKTERIIALQEEDLEQLHLELSGLKCTCDEIRLTALREKEEMWKHIQSANYNKHLTKKDNESSTNCDSIANSIGNITSNYETVITDLTSDVKKIKSDFEHQQKSFENISKEKTEILSKYLTLQSCLSEKENTIEKLETNLKDIKNKLLLASSREEKQNKELLELKKACTKLEVELNLKNKDKIFEHTVTTIREQFKLISNKYLQLKSELQCKNKEILQLQYEKQELCVDSNRKIAEVKKNMEKDAVDIKNLKQRIVSLEELETDVKTENKTQLETITNLNIEIIQLRSYHNKVQTNHADLIFKCDNNILQNNNVDVHLQEVEYPVTSQYYRSKKKNIEDDCSFSITNLIDILKYICKLCKMGEDDYTKSSSTDSDEEYIKLLLHKIESYHRFVDIQVTAKLKKKLDATKRNILSKILHLVERCKMLETKVEENAQMLKLNAMHRRNDQDINFKEEIQRLQVQLAVKMREEKEKQKRYERNYRTLLRKVKEHMKGRKSADKSNDYLQQLYNTLSSEHNTLRLEVDLKQSQLNELQDRMEKSFTANEKLKSTVLKLEKKFSNFSSRCKCLDYEKSKSKCIELEKCLKACENSKNTSMAELKLKEDILEILQKENKGLLVQNSSNCARVKDLENELTEIQCCDEQLRKEIGFLQNDVSKTRDNNAELNNRLDHITNENIQLQQNIEQLNSHLQRKSEEVSEFKLRKEQSIRRWLETETNMQKLIATLKNQVYTFRDEVNLLKNEKFFLKRLCNDLNVALKTHVSQNKSLKEYVERVCEERERFGNDTSILSNFPSPIKRDDTYIEKLLQENMMPFQDKPYCDIQECLNTLKKEILCLQKDIAEKNITLIS